MDCKENHSHNWNETFDFLDTDHSGVLEYDEFKTGALDRKYLLSEENLESIFLIFDLKKNGYLSYEELNNVINGKI